MVPFLAKKVLTSLVLPPGLFVVLLLSLALFLRKRGRVAVVCLAFLVYVMSIEPTANLLLVPLEDAFSRPSAKELASCDAFVMLGGGVYKMSTATGSRAILSEEATTRAVEAYRLTKSTGKPVILSGGVLFGRTAEADVAEAFLLSLGAPKALLIKESRSVDTLDNARFTAALCRERGFRRIGVVTSSYHMQRSVFLFSRLFGQVVPCPVGFRTNRTGYTTFSFLPSTGSLDSLSTALKEWLGLFAYRLMPPGQGSSG